MFVRVKKIGAYEYLYLVENAREGGRHVQRVVKALGRRDEVEASGMLDAVAASAARHSRRSIVLSRFYRGELAELRRVSIGPDLVFGRLWRETGCAEVIRALLVGRRFGFDVERAIYLTVLHRLMVSGSDRHASRWHHGFRIPGAEELMLDHAYRAMIWLGEEADGRTTTDAIEEDLYRHRQELFGEVSIAFFDTTSLYFEGAGGPTLGQLGHSKDYRPHLKQVVLGMVLDGDDRPFASFLWPGDHVAVGTVERTPAGDAALQGPAHPRVDARMPAAKLLENRHRADARRGLQHRHDLAVPYPHLHAQDRLRHPRPSARTAPCQQARIADGPRSARNPPAHQRIGERHPLPSHQAKGQRRHKERHRSRLP